MILFFPLFIHLLFPTANTEHAIYLSVLELDGQEMKVKVFTDNLEDAIKNDASSIEGYFQKKINLQINEEKLSFCLKEMTEEGESHWITFGFNAPETMKSLHLEASYFMELFPDQTNVVKVIGDKLYFFRLTKFNPSCSFSL